MELTGPIDPLRLTALSSGAGCGCKLPAGALLRIVRDLPRTTDPRVLVGTPTGDDAAVFLLREDLAVVQTVDFFTPPVDDPYDFGRIAAANALSDVYAMGGLPLTALSIVAFPLERLGDEALGRVLQGAVDVVGAAGASLVGGHSIADEEPKFGLAVLGTVDPSRVTTNAGGRAGDVLVLTKPLGTGAVITAQNRSGVEPGLLRRAVDVMAELNAAAAAAAVGVGVQGMTDVTGFGLLGHLHNLCRESGVAAQIDASAVPILPGVEALLRRDDVVSGGTRRNAEWAQSFTTFGDDVAPWQAWLVCDATTSGGLLMAVDPARVSEVPGVAIGQLVHGQPGAIVVR